MVRFRVVDGDDEHTKPAVRPNFPFYEHTNEQPEPIQEEHYNLFVEENRLLVASFVRGDFEEVFRHPLYDEYDDSGS